MRLWMASSTITSEHNARRTEDLVDGGALLELILRLHVGALLLHEQHERVQWLLHALVL